MGNKNSLGMDHVTNVAVQLQNGSPPQLPMLIKQDGSTDLDMWQGSAIHLISLGLLRCSTMGCLGNGGAATDVRLTPGYVH